MIPTFAANGARLRDRSLANIEHLLKLSLVVVRRNKRGRLLCAQFRPSSGANPLRQSAHVGTRYSYLARIHEVRVWTFSDLLGETENKIAKLSKSERAERDAFVRAVFRAVPLSCMAGPASRRKAKVVSIESGRRPRPEPLAA